MDFEALALNRIAFMRGIAIQLGDESIALQDRATWLRARADELHADADQMERNLAARKEAASE